MNDEAQNPNEAMEPVSKGYKTQSYVWRSLALVQMPLAAIAIFIFLVIYFSRDTIINVPQKLPPGHQLVKDLPDAEFLNVSLEVVNLLATYQPFTVKNQFESAKKYFTKALQTSPVVESLLVELKSIEQRRESQWFDISLSAITLNRSPDQQYVDIQVPGVQYKSLEQLQQPPVRAQYLLRLTTIPGKQFNEYGIVVSDMKFRSAAAGPQ